MNGNPKVTQLISAKSGNPVANQFEIVTPDGRYFQSYNTIIAHIDNIGMLSLDENAWNYSSTTSKYRNQFTGWDTPETKRRIKDGRIALVDLNHTTQCPKTGEEHATWEQDNHEQKCLDCGATT